ncbi:UDP-glucose 4-epimerase [[Actinomadura] parvosata subsp. kistnae]|uniref:Epimerase n=1 Tax=[Actinomadura] parvosata subsp. kistnae TaxID=1909395 RepID=A0A1U9ZT72_9ACTN|nr:NAD(P)-dependent oxidoreductase [Nonomuraea sp. ATCC 55076]AQZ61133.1 epimerase [Nonomuraea sp. ATCC 55076]SPL87484.1 UDP-glucose 4-epimerase [Actinomadura parvosata subsp. kistnae]
MILITGGLGFIGTHTTRALLDLGESCVLVQRRPADVPAAFAAEAGERLFVEQADIADERAVLAIGERHDITGILHLAGSMPWPVGAYEPIEHTERALGSLLTLFRAARDWRVRRLGLASTIGVYAGVTADGPLREDLPLTMSAPHVIPRFKKIGELLAGHLEGVLGIEAVNYRIGGIWGPLGHNPDPFFPAPQLVHAAARGTEPDLSGMMGETRRENGIDVCYVKDCARALALLQTAGALRHRTYNVASGRVTTNGELIEAIRKHVPDARLDGVEPGRVAARVDNPLDITRLREDTGFEPAYDTVRAVGEYLEWLRAGNER